MAPSKGIQVGWLGTFEQGSLSLSFQQGLKHQQTRHRLTCIHEARDLGADHAQLQPVGEQQSLLRGVNQKSCRKGLFLWEPYIQQGVKITIPCLRGDRKLFPMFAST